MSKDLTRERAVVHPLVARSGAMNKGLEAIRTHLGMEVAYISEFVGEHSLFRAVDAPGFEGVIKPGDSQPLDDIFCRHILAGRLPELIPDVSNEPLAMSLPIMQRVPIGSHVSVPIKLENGETYGMFCCLSLKADPTLNARDLDTLRVFADMAAHEINEERKAKRAAEESAERIRSVIARNAFRPVYQPIFDLETGRIVGLEALCRFADEPIRSPDNWFREAAACGEGLSLELATIRRAVAASADFPRDLYLSINASPELLLSGQLLLGLSGDTRRRIVIELTEHAPVSDYAMLTTVLGVLRKRGCDIAIDDAGAGYSSLQHIVQLKPDMIKLDIGLVRSVDTDPSRRALISALLHFASETGSVLVAEGIETEAECNQLRKLGINRGQGYLLGRPLEAEAVLSAVARKRASAA